MPRCLPRRTLPINNELFAQSLHEARAGAKIIVWSEGAAGVVQEDEAALLKQASAFTRTTGTYLDMGVSELLVHPRYDPVEAFAVPLYAG